MFDDGALRAAEIVKTEYLAQHLLGRRTNVGWAALKIRGLCRWTNLPHWRYLLRRQLHHGLVRDSLAVGVRPGKLRSGNPDPVAAVGMARWHTAGNRRARCGATPADGSAQDPKAGTRRRSGE